MTTPPGEGPSASFSAVDTSAESAQLLLALDLIAVLPAVQRLRAAATALLAPQFGDRLLDVGCGTGDVVRSLAAAVGPTGSVVGVDPSELMLAEARRRTADRYPTVEYRVGDASSLEVDDESVDGVRCERVFQHLADPERAMVELVRVTRPGGRVVVVDTDWGMHAVHGADPALTARVLTAWADHLPNGWSGRRLWALFTDAGIDDPTVVGETFATSDPQRPTQPPFPMIAGAAAATGAVSADEAETWLAQLVDAAGREHFFWAFTMFAVGGRRP